MAANEKVSSTEIAVVALGFVAGGLAIVLPGLLKGGGPSAGTHKFQALTSPTLEGQTQLQVTLGQPVKVQLPTVQYMGPGLDVFTYVDIRQTVNNQQVSVYGSGVAGIHVGPATQFQVFPLVAADQPEPPDCMAQGLCAYPWPGVTPTPICGAPPTVGSADVYLMVFGRRDPQDGDGFASPTCGSATVHIPRRPYLVQRYAGKVVFRQP